MRRVKRAELGCPSVLHHLLVRCMADGKEVKESGLVVHVFRVHIVFCRRFVFVNVS